ncbi:40S ribosomal protein S20 [Tupaia chinensis]|uniref:Small ribosomal subunit protein uS10 n=1 Tax=Tupaia chinensis TaxID=246437 RepID=L8Y7P2_TUPCH|nr:40S ribosomal protein S20 [Tupaia chinensis]
MAFKDTRKTPVELEVAIQRIRLTLTSHDVKSLEKVCADSTRNAKKKNLKVKGSVGMPTKTLRITTGKTSVGLCSDENLQATELHSPSEIVKQIISISIEPGVEVKITTADAYVNYLNKLIIS